MTLAQATISGPAVAGTRIGVVLLDRRRLCLGATEQALRDVRFVGRARICGAAIGRVDSLAVRLAAAAVTLAAMVEFAT
jgi:hypothetical protein